MKAFLFDIDGTLIRTGKLGRSPYKEAIFEIFKVEVDLSAVDWFGRADLDILSELLEIHGISHKKFLSRWQDLKKLYIRYLRESFEKTPDSVQVLPGVLSWLKKLKKHAVGIVTGNIREAAGLKLKSAGISHYFPQDIGGFGEEHANREILVKKALQRMQHYYRSDCFESVWVIGDSHRDILSASQNGLNSLAVATGKQSEKTLMRHQPTLILKNLEAAPPENLENFKPTPWPKT